MSVSSVHEVADGLYVPFRGYDPREGPIGTLFVDASDSGDGSGGTVKIDIHMAREEFGFHIVWVPTRAVMSGGQVAADIVTMFYTAEGNERLDDNIQENLLTVAGVGAVFAADFKALSVPVEGFTELSARVLSFQWTTNTNAVVYHAHVFGVLYDAEAIVHNYRRGRAVDPLLAGIR